MTVAGSLHELIYCRLVDEPFRTVSIFDEQQITAAPRRRRANLAAVLHAYGAGRSVAVADPGAAWTARIPSVAAPGGLPKSEPILVKTGRGGLAYLSNSPGSAGPPKAFRTARRLPGNFRANAGDRLFRRPAMSPETSPRDGRCHPWRIISGNSGVRPLRISGAPRRGEFVHAAILRRRVISCSWNLTGANVFELA